MHVYTEYCRWIVASAYFNIWLAGTHIFIAHTSEEMAVETSSGPIDIDIE